MIDTERDIRESVTAMSGLFETIGEFYVVGVITAVTAFCVIVLYPAFLARLARQAAESPEHRDDPKVLGLFGVLVSAGVITFMAVIGLIFTYVLEESLTVVIENISPVAFAFLFVYGLLLAFDVKLSRQVRPIRFNNPYVAAFVYGFLFGAIVIPCNPGVIALAFARASLIPAAERMTAFLAFGVGISTPLLAFSLISRAGSRWLINFLVDHKKWINRLAGGFMAGVSVYYLFFVFQVQDRLIG